VDRREVDLDSITSGLESSPHDVPIVGLSLRSLNDPKIEGSKAHLTKPVTRTRLLETLSRVSPAARNVLVLDDDPRMRHFLAATLESSDRGYLVETTGSPSEAIRRLREGAAHVLLLDLRLPEMDGASVLRLLREDEFLSQIPAITISAYMNPTEELAKEREALSLSCKRRLGRPQLLAVLKATLDETSPRFHWEGLAPTPGEAAGG
jgi:CheY-like chemotaxis protein